MVMDIDEIRAYKKYHKNRSFVDAERITDSYGSEKVS